MKRNFLKAALAAVVVLCGPIRVGAQAENCSVDIQASDAMQFSTKKITVPKGCINFTVNLRHVGRMPKTAMGHNWVLTKESDYKEVVKAGVKAGASKEYLELPDGRILAHTQLIGGGESTSVTFAVNLLQPGVDYVFFCSFPGHFALMKGVLVLE